MEAFTFDFVTKRLCDACRHGVPDTFGSDPRGWYHTLNGVKINCRANAWRLQALELDPAAKKEDTTLHVSEIQELQGLVNYIKRQKAWSEKTFGPGTRKEGICKHIEKELAEVRAEYSGYGFVDVIILALDGLWRAGNTPESIVEALENKQRLNRNRKFPPPGPQDQPTEHITPALANFKIIEVDQSKSASMKTLVEFEEHIADKLAHNAQLEADLERAKKMIVEKNTQFDQFEKMIVDRNTRIEQLENKFITLARLKNEQVDLLEKTLVSFQNDVVSRNVRIEQLSSSIQKAIKLIKPDGQVHMSLNQFERAVCDWASNAQAVLVDGK